MKVVSPLGSGQPDPIGALLLPMLSCWHWDSQWPDFFALPKKQWLGTQCTFKSGPRSCMKSFEKIVRDPLRRSLSEFFWKRGAQDPRACASLKTCVRALGRGRKILWQELCVRQIAIPRPNVCKTSHQDLFNIPVQELCRPLERAGIADLRISRGKRGPLSGFLSADLDQSVKGAQAIQHAQSLQRVARTK